MAVNDNNCIIQVRNLLMSFRTPAGDIPVLKGVNMDVHTGESLAILGPSGSGKSTLLFILGLFLTPTAGSYVLNGRELIAMDEDAQAELRRHYFGFVFQSCNLIENSTVFEDLEYPLIYAGVFKHERRERVSEVLKRVRMEHRINHRTNLLSGGEQQRVAVARALINRPRVILADEPTGQLDGENSQHIMDLFLDCISDGKTSLILVTHDHKVADRCARTCYFHNGIVTETGSEP